LIDLYELSSYSEATDAFVIPRYWKSDGRFS